MHSDTTSDDTSSERDLVWRLRYHRQLQACPRTSKVLIGTTVIFIYPDCFVVVFYHYLPPDPIIIIPSHIMPQKYDQTKRKHGQCALCSRRMEKGRERCIENESVGKYRKEKIDIDRET